MTAQSEPLETPSELTDVRKLILKSVNSQMLDLDNLEADITRLVAEEVRKAISHYSLAVGGMLTTKKQRIEFVKYTNKFLTNTESKEGGGK